MPDSPPAPAAALAPWAASIDDWLAAESRVHTLGLSGRTDLIPLGLGLPAAELFPADAIRAASERVLAGGAPALQYAAPPVRLAEHIVSLMAARGVACATENIVLTNGAQQAMSLLAQLLVDRDRTVIVEERSFSGLRWAVQPMGPRLATVPVDLDTGISIDGLEAVLARTRQPALVYVMGTGHNPLGVTLAADKRRRLVELARQHGAWIVEDDAYGFLQYEDELPAIRALDEERVLYVGSFSKILAPGLRVGWVVAPRAIAARLAFVKSAANLDTSTLPQQIVAAYLDGGALGAHIDTLRQAYRRRRDAMLAAIAAHVPPGVRYTRPTGGMFVWLELPAHIDTMALLEEAVRDQGVMFFPGHSCASDARHPSGHCLRLCFSNATPARITEGVARLGALIRARLDGD